MSMIEDIKRDREAGTPGPWGNGRTGEEQRLILSRGGKGRYVCNVQIFQTPRHMGLWEEDSREANARRIARVPELEAALLAAEELADAVDEWGAKGRTEATAAALNTALGNYRAATEGKA